MNTDPALRCARIAATVYQPRGIPRWLHDHLADLETGCDKATSTPHDPPESELIGTAEAAAIVGVSAAFIRRNPADFDGRQIADRTWLYPRRTVEEYAEHRRQRLARRHAGRPGKLDSAVPDGR